MKNNFLDFRFHDNYYFISTSLSLQALGFLIIQIFLQGPQKARVNWLLPLFLGLGPLFQQVNCSTVLFCSVSLRLVSYSLSSCFLQKLFECLQLFKHTGLPPLLGLQCVSFGSHHRQSSWCTRSLMKLKPKRMIELLAYCKHKISAREFVLSVVRKICWHSNVPLDLEVC